MASSNPKNDLVQMGIILMSLDKDGSFDSCGIIGGNLSAFRHIVRLVALKEVETLVPGSEGNEDQHFEYVWCVSE